MEIRYLRKTVLVSPEFFLFHSKTRGFFHQPLQLAGSAAAPPAPPELTLFTLNLTGKVSLVSVKKGRLRTKSAIFDSSLGQKGETTNTQTSVGKQYGLVLFTEIFLNHRPSGIWGSYMDSPPLETTDYPRWDLFSRKVTPSNRGPSTLGAVFPDGRPFQLGTVHAGTCFPGRSTLGAGRDGARRHATPG